MLTTWIRYMLTHNVETNYRSLMVYILLSFLVLTILATICGMVHIGLLLSGELTITCFGISIISREKPGKAD